MCNQEDTQFHHLSACAEFYVITCVGSCPFLEQLFALGFHVHPNLLTTDLHIDLQFLYKVRGLCMYCMESSHSVLLIPQNFTSKKRVYNEI